MRTNAMRLAKLGIAASTAAIGGAAIYLARDHIFGPASSANDTSLANPALVPRHSTDAAAARAPRIAERFRRLWPEVTGRPGPMPEAALEIALAQAWLESGLAEAGGGGWWKDKTAQGQGSMVGSGNLGSRHCGAGDTGGAYYRCVPYGDTVAQPDGTNKPYDVSFRYYTGGMCGGKERDAGDCAAWDFLYDITRRWPGLAELESGDVLAYAMKLGPKYGANDVPNQTVFGRRYPGGTGYYGGFGKSMQKRVGGYAYAIASHLPAIAAALGHARIFAKVAAPILTYSDKDDEIRTAPAAVAGVEHCSCDGKPQGTCVQWGCAAQRHAPIEGVGTVIAVVAGLVAIFIASGFVSLHNAEAEALQFIGALRTAGFDVVPPGEQARDGWRAIDTADPGLAKAAKAGGEKGDQMLRALAAKGFTFQTQKAGRIKLQIPKRKPGTPASSAPYDAAANWTAAAQTALDKCLAKPGGDLITCAQDPSVINATKNPAAAAAEAAKLAAPAKPSTPALEEDRIPLPGNPAAKPSTPALEEDRIPVRTLQEELHFERVNADGSTTPLQGSTEAEITEAQARASDAHAIKQTAHLEGVGAVAAVAAGGLAAGALVAAAVHLATKPAEAAPDAAAPAPAAPAPAPSSPAASTAPAAPKAPAPAPKPAQAPAAKPKPASKPVEHEPEEEPGILTQLSDMLPGGDDEVTVSKVKREKKKPIQGAEDDDAGEMLRALHLAGVLPRARALPVTGELFWFLEEADPSVDGIQVRLAGLEEEIAELAAETEATTQIAEAVLAAGDEAPELDLGDAAKNPHCGCTGCSFMEPHVHAFCPEQAAADLGAARQQDPVDKGLQTASDVATVATSLLAAGAAIKNIAQTNAIDPDPKCRELLRTWVEKHKWLHRIGMLTGGPDLTALAGTDEAPPAAPELVDRYLDALMEIRGWAEPGEDRACEISPEEDRAVLVHLGATAQEIDAIYKVASRSGAMVADLFAPGVGRGLTATADAIRAQVDPTVQAQERAKRKPEGKAAAKCQTDLADARAQIARVGAYHDAHPTISRWLRIPDPRKPAIAGADEAPPAGEPPTIESRPIAGTPEPSGAEG